VTGPHDSDLPPGRRRRGEYLLMGKIPIESAHPLEIAYCVKHITQHPNLAADAWRRTREDQVLAELRASLGAVPWAHFGEATLRALVVTGGSECPRCRANLIARVRRLSAPDFSPEMIYLLGPGCARCRRTGRATIRPSTVVRSTPVRPHHTGGTAPPDLPTLRRWVD
jgi:hypothetical protein